MYRLLAATLWALLTGGYAWCEPTAQKIGLLAPGGDRAAPDRFAATADYLARHIPGETFSAVPLTRAAINDAVARGELAFVITDPGHSEYLEATYGTRSVATAQDSWHGDVYSVIAAAIITRADRRDIAWMSDLKGKSFMADSRNSFEGFQIAWWELKAHDIDPFHDFTRLVFSDLAPEGIVDAVRRGSVDAAAVESGALERMADEGRLDLDEFRILHPRTAHGYPFARSTELYPEWTLLKVRETPDELAQHVAVALRSMPARDQGAPALQYAAWTAPADRGPIRELLRDLRLPPYGEPDSLTDVARRYWPWFAPMLAVLVLLAAAVVHMLRVNRRLQLSRSYLERARQLEGQLAHVGRIVAMGEMATMLAHELNQPLAAIVNYARGSIRRVRSEGMSEDELIPVLERIATEGKRSAEIIARLRDFLRKRKPAQVQSDINRIVREAAVLAEVEARQKAVTVHVDLAEEPETVLADPIQIEQVVLNLVHNAIEAIDDARWPRREVFIETRPRPGKGVEVTVRDTGPGFPKNGTERIFEPFVSTKPGGMGLGLSISRSIVEAHGDSLQATLSPGGGAAFYFTLRTFDRARAQ